MLNVDVLLRTECCNYKLIIHPADMHLDSVVMTSSVFPIVTGPALIVRTVLLVHKFP